MGASALKAITLVTGNENKATEISEIIGFPMRIAPLDLSEIQGTVESIATDKARKAAELINGPVLVEDTSLFFDALNGLPGPYIKHFLKSLNCKGLKALLKGFTSCLGTAVCTFAYCPGKGEDVILFSGEIRGEIVEPRSEKGFGWDPIFKPLGYDETFAEMDPGLKNTISHRAASLRKLSEYFGRL